MRLRSSHRKVSEYTRTSHCVLCCYMWSWKSLEWLTYFWLLAGLIGLMNKCMVSSLITQYAQVVLWFCRTGLLPEGSGMVLVHSDSLKNNCALHMINSNCSSVNRGWWCAADIKALLQSFYYKELLHQPEGGAAETGQVSGWISEEPLGFYLFSIIYIV